MFSGVGNGVVFVRDGEADMVSRDSAVAGETLDRFWGACIYVIRIVSVAAYLAGATASILLINANGGDGALAVAIWMVASVLLGWGTGQPALALLAFLAIPFAVPFGYPDHYEFSEPLPIWWSAAFCAPFSAALIAVAALVRRIVEARRRLRESADLQPR
jgi:hypothetical protein